MKILYKLVIAITVVCLSTTENDDLNSQATQTLGEDDMSYTRYDDVSIPTPSFQRRYRRHTTNCSAGIQYKRLYVTLGGNISTIGGAHRIEIGGSPNVSHDTLLVAANVIALMTKHMPRTVFETLAANGAKAGVFTGTEGLTIFPEYCHLKDTVECKGNCSGKCNALCTFDGRKYASLPGLGGQRAVAVDDNLLCTRRDPYGRTFNMLIHEFAHSILSNSIYKLTRSDWGRRLNAAYQAAKSNQTWNVQSYAMANGQEYWAESTGVFFNAHQLDSTGGMNKCGKSGRQRCNSQSEARTFLRLRDPNLYSILAYIYTNNNDHIDSGLRTCMTL